VNRVSFFVLDPGFKPKEVDRLYFLRTKPEPFPFTALAPTGARIELLIIPYYVFIIIHYKYYQFSQLKTPYFWVYLKVITRFLG